MSHRRGAGRLVPLALALAGLALTAALLGCGPRPEPVVPPGDDPVAVRQNDGSLWLRWQQAPAGRVWVYVGDDPDAIDRSSPLGELVDGEFVATGLPADRRPYFELVPDTGRSLVVAERLLPLEGAHNFRDLGGYPTEDGRRVRWGVLYRSDHLGSLTDDDLAYLEQLHIRTVCDFRGASERESEPDRLGASEVPRHVNPAIADERFAMEELRDRLVTGDLGSIDFANLLVEGNRAFARDYGDQYARFLDLVQDPSNLPLVFHCTAGKDRAGFAAAVLLTALGVSEKDVVRDYLLTQPYTQAHIEKTLRTIRLVSFFRTDVERVRPLLGVQESYIRAGLDTAKQDHGSLEAYLDDALGLDPKRRAALRDLLLR